VTVESFTAQFTYTPDPDGGFDIQLTPGTYTVSTQVLPSVSPNPPVTWADNIALTGLAGNNNSVLTLASTTANIEHQIAQSFDFVSATTTGAAAIRDRYRICARARSLVWQGN
jgi:hypothetical protein